MVTVTNSLQVTQIRPNNFRKNETSLKQVSITLSGTKFSLHVTCCPACWRLLRRLNDRSYNPVFRNAHRYTTICTVHSTFCTVPRLELKCCRSAVRSNGDTFKSPYYNIKHAKKSEDPVTEKSKSSSSLQSSSVVSCTFSLNSKRQTALFRITFDRFSFHLWWAKWRYREQSYHPKKLPRKKKN